MANDPNLNEACIFLNDGPPATWWMSPDIKLTGPISGSDKADPNPNNNVVEITVRQNAGCNLPATVGVIKIDVYVADPSLVFTPISNSTKITNTPGRPTVALLPTDLSPGSFKAKSFNWQIPVTPTPSETPGHKCLVARVYPDSVGPPASGNFYCPDDPHVAQRNICIVPCSGRGGGGMAAQRGESPREGEGCEFDVQTVNLQEEIAEAVTLKVAADPTPTQFVLDTVNPLLQEVAGFRRLAPLVPQGFSLRLPDFPDATVRDNTRPGCLGQLLGSIYPPLGRVAQPTYEADVVLKPAQLTAFTLQVDLSKTQMGEAHIFHLTQVGPQKVVQGGLTAVFVKV